MSAIHRAVATLRIAGDDLNPAEISELIGAVPDHAQVKGQELPTKSAGGIRIAKFGLWRLDATATEPEDFDSQVLELLDKLTPDLTIWHSLAQRYTMNLFCGWFMEEGNEGAEISAQSLMALGERRIALSLDIYAPESESTA